MCQAYVHPLPYPVQVLSCRSSSVASLASSIRHRLPIVLPVRLLLDPLHTALQPSIEVRARWLFRCPHSFLLLYQSRIMVVEARNASSAVHLPWAVSAAVGRPLQVCLSDDQGYQLYSWVHISPAGLCCMEYRHGVQWYSGRQPAGPALSSVDLPCQS